MVNSPQLACRRSGLQCWWRNEQGQSMVEYLLLLAVIIVIVISAINLYTGPLGELYTLIQTTFTEATNHLAF